MADVEAQLEVIRDEAVKDPRYAPALDLLWTAELQAEGTYEDAILDLEMAAIQAVGKWDEYAKLLDESNGCGRCGCAVDSTDLESKPYPLSIFNPSAN